MATIAALAPVVPVLTIERVGDAVPLARALVRGGIPALEVTLRTEAALEAIARIAAEVPEAVVGAGTVRSPQQLEAARGAGARFAVSPGCTATLLQAARETGTAFLPGVQTVSEAMALADWGYRLLKLFPADAAGGMRWLQAVRGPLPELQFCPTGGVGADTAPAFLLLANVACVGGSWLAPRDAVAAGDWERIERLAAQAATLKRP
ncbi:MAG: bifunctional 4-hydroxy-2-oxoglutarate aldolase/2-dehydro-3-deoxy-phosphogluconate aldolase [Alphaproteobacteria bacterium]|nr:bifunctional 4-hydroxy-2-oxoglutarate aldolase/2-dehydro-3-deoxy-phosphogluconate aldolase [Alphaproteobacteria bacterium]